jgi:cytochrome c oxidase assembly protein subunit 11
LEASRHHENRRLLRRIGWVTAGAFAFCFALVPLYRIACEQLGIRIDGDAVAASGVATLKVDASRTVTVQFDSTVNALADWRFAPDQLEMQVHPGQVVEAWYTASNLTDDTLVAQAVPDVLPRRANPYFGKTECFCFTEQLFAPRETRRMPVRFFVAPDLPDDVKTVMLTYTFYNNENASRREQARLAATPVPIDPRG